MWAKVDAPPPTRDARRRTTNPTPSIGRGGGPGADAPWSFCKMKFVVVMIENLEARMSRRCDVTGAKPSFGNAVSHSHRRTRRRWNPNLQNHRYWLPSERRFVRLTLTAKALKTVDRKGIEAVVAELRGRGVRL